MATLQIINLEQGIQTANNLLAPKVQRGYVHYSDAVEVLRKAGIKCPQRQPDALQRMHGDNYINVSSVATFLGEALLSDALKAAKDAKTVPATNPTPWA
ncbi:MAG: hypothetical protein WAQ53_15445 [Thiofilum sp.]|uniref:hypothetical protein n=1 Tax=Thiofilum sp. TaxID=2212733 RepID=UPI0025E7ADBB|nr:hypothetical protein [Thiofilum sp.]MBK8451756.1 hypothetical protein [Thiofilum sp.]